MDAPVIYIDIETRRPQSDRLRDYLVKNVKPDSRLKDPAKVQASIRANQLKAIQDASLSPMWGEVAVVCCAVDDEPIRAFVGTDEAVVLAELNTQLQSIYYYANCRQPIFCGFNISQFDMRFLWTRMLINGIKTMVNLQHDAKPWSEKLIDLRMILSGGDKTAKGTLQDWIVAFGGDVRENDIPGKDVPAAIEEGRLDEVVAHCRRDVEDCRFLHRKLL